MSPYQALGELSTKILVKSAEIWPKAVGLQQEMSHEVKRYQLWKQAGKEVGSWFCGVEIEKRITDKTDYFRESEYTSTCGKVNCRGCSGCER